MKFQQVPTFQVAIVTATLITCLSHIGDLLLWTALVGFALAMLRYGTKAQESNSDNHHHNYFPDEEQEINNSEPEVQLADLTELQEDLWQEVKAMDKQEKLGTTPEVQADVVDADTIVEPTPDLMQSAEEKAAARWGYKGANVKPPIPATNDTEIGLMTARLKLVIPKETGKARKTWASLCKQLQVSGYTSKKDAKASVKALWLSQQGVSFQNVVKASLKLAA